MCGRNGGKYTRETHEDDSNKGDDKEKSGVHDNKNTNGKSKGSFVTPKRGKIREKILKDLNPWATEG
uniref:Uncharacterized protein n=1 Tax=Solanum lycopersicum TaxID=4081 RepID=A0A3Q7GUH0_SOLLC